MKRIGIAVLILCAYCVSMAWAQQPAAKVQSWSEFHFANMMRWNSFEHVLNVKNVGELTLQWSYLAGGSVRSSPAVALGMVNFGSYDGHLYALNASSGGRLWRVLRERRRIYSSPAVALRIGERPLVLVGLEGGSVIARRASAGWDVWGRRTGGPVSCSPTVVDGVAYIGSDDDNVYALGMSGNQLWSYTTGGGVDSSPAVANGVVYVGSLDNNVYALDASTGTLLWRYATGGGVDSSPAVANGVVYVGSADKNLYALNASTGVLLFSYKTGGPVYSSPAVANGMVYIGSDDHNIYAFGLK